jgi:biotin carboxyl carrier protein
MNAKVIKLMAAVGHAIQPGQVVCKLEAMKMEIEVRAPLEGTLSAIHVTVGQQVKSGQPLATIN